MGNIISSLTIQLIDDKVWCSRSVSFLTWVDLGGKPLLLTYNVPQLPNGLAAPKPCRPAGRSSRPVSIP